MADYSEQELEQIRSILDPLNKNPESSEDLNPMLSSFREKMGYGVPVSIGDDDEEQTEEGSEESFDLGDEDETPTPIQKPKPLSFSEDDDIDLDELLTEPSQGGEPSADAGEDPFGGFDEAPTTSDDFGDFATPEPESDPFADSGLDDFGAPSEEAEPSAELEDFGAPTSEEDPFGGFDAAPELDTPFETSPTEDFGSAPSADPFADSDLGMDDFGTAPSSDSEDPFAGSGLEDFDAPPSSGGDDPFAAFDASGMEDTPGDEFGLEEGDPFGASPSSGDSDFGDLGGFDSEPSDSGDFGGSDFAEAPTDSDPFADFAPVSGGDHDPFSDLSGATSIPESDPFADFATEPASAMEMESVPESSDFTSFSPDLDSDSGDEDLGSAAFEEDLRSLGGEDKDEIDKSLTDEELAIIQREILRYPPLLRRTVIESIVQDRLSKKAQRDLLELIKIESSPEDIAAFLSSALGITVALTDRTGAYSADGVPIISSDPIYTREGVLERRKKIRRTFFAAAAALLIGFGSYFTYKHIILPRQAAQNYEAGLEQIREMGAKRFAGTLGEEDRKKYLISIEDSYDKGFDIDPYNLKYMNLYGVEYSRAGEYELSFQKLFGKIEPDLGMGTLDSWNKREQSPMVRLAQGESWNDKKLKTSAGVNQGKEGIKFLLDQEKTPRKVLIAGAFLAMRLKERTHDNNTYRNLGWFHSQIMPDFAEPTEGKKGRYKNDALAVDYYSKVFTDGESPYDEDSTAGIAKIYYNRREFGKAASFYNRIVEANPKSIPGQAGLVSTYLEMWKESGDPQFVLNHHRLLRNNLDMESELPFYTLAKLASFYAAIDPEELRIKYNINPVDQVSGIEIEESAIRLLDTIYRKSMEDERTGVEIEGKDYAEGYYQRGQYYLSQKENSNARRFFEKAATLDPKHWLAVLELAEHSIRVGNFEEAKDLLKEAESRYEMSERWFGSKDEDETLFEGNPARIHFDLGKIRYLLSAGLSDKDSLKEFPGRKIYPFRSRSESDGKSLSVLKEEEEKRNRRNELRNSLQEFAKVDSEEPKFDLIRKWRRELPQSMLREMKFFKGWVEYMDSDFDKSLADWTGFEDKDEYYNPTLLMAKGNAFFYTGQTKTALGYFLRVKDDMEEKLPQMSSPKTEDPYHQEVYQTLTAAYNNIGACYETLSKKANAQESENYTAQALQNYWKAIETARKINEASEISLANKDLLFKKEALKREPLLEDWVSPTLDSIKDLVRK
ncbi:tetratricopeptide repeat protein [Leptospira sp. SA-E8]|uniref:tetratricopeptide repeat protein n=1 Tax=Leptospira sp. SA-E8 TaxID=3422259 RepID=UPI003EBA4D0B